MIKIVACDCAPYSWALGERTANANRTWGERRGVFVRLRTSIGIDGYGEAAPLPGFSPDDLDTCTEALSRAWRSCAPLANDEPALEALRAALAPANVGSASATFALESAMLDVLGKSRGVPAWRLVRAPDDGEPEPIPVATLLSSTSIEGAVSQATTALARGVKVGKIKVDGRAGEQEIARIEAIHDAVAPLGMTLRLDANQSFSHEDFAPRMDRFCSVAPDVFEEPIASGDWRGIAPSSLRLGMDESLLDPHWRQNADAARARGVAGALVIKPAVIGGWLRALEMARHARSLDWWAYVTHLFDGPIASAATAELALAMGGAPHPSGVDTFGRVADWPTGAPPQIGPSHITAGVHHGLGVDAIAREIWRD